MSGKDEVSTDSGNCAEALKSMYLFLDKEQLSADDRAHVQEHLDGCIPCLESYEFEAELKQVIKKKCHEDMPSALYEKVRVSLKAEIQHQIQQTPPTAE